MLIKVVTVTYQNPGGRPATRVHQDAIMPRPKWYVYQNFHDFPSTKCVWTCRLHDVDHSGIQLVTTLVYLYPVLLWEMVSIDQCDRSALVAPLPTAICILSTIKDGQWWYISIGVLFDRKQNTIFGHFINFDARQLTDNEMTHPIKKSHAPETLTHICV